MIEHYLKLRALNQNVANSVVAVFVLVSLVMIAFWAMMYSYLPHLHVAFALLTFPLVGGIFLLGEITSNLLYRLALSYHPHPVSLTLTLKE